MNKPLISRIPLVILYIVCFFSGAGCLIYELVWSRYLTLVFGASVYAIASVTACFMLGLALGSWIIGKTVDRVSKQRNVLIWVLIGTGIYGFLSPVIFNGVARLTEYIPQNVYNIDYLRNMIRLGLSFLILIPPTFLMGGTFPGFIKLFNGICGQDIRSVGKEAGKLYSLNTLGGVMGAFGAGFFLIRFLGMKNTVYLAAIIYFICGSLLFLFNREFTGKNAKNKAPGGKTREIKPGKTKLAQKGSLGSGAEVRPYSSKIIVGALAVFAVSGFTSLAYEVLWTKVLTLFFRDSIYDFTIVLSAFLSGIVIGSYFCAKWIGKSNNPLAPLALTEILIGIFSMVSLFLISRFPYIASFLQSMPKLYAQFGNNYWVTAVAIRFGYAFLVVLIPTSLFGTTFPLVSKITTTNFQKLGSGIGLMNGLNTLGATLGSLLAGFVFIVLMGIQKSIMLMAFLNIGIGLILLGLVSFHNRKLKPALMTTSFIAVLIIAVLIPRWDKLRMSTNIIDPKQPIEQILSLLYYHEDAYGITSVTEFKPRQIKILTTNRLFSQNTSAMMGLEDHRRLGHIPLLLHPNPHTVLVIGLGAGISLRGVSEHQLAAVDCVEISGGVIQAARYFARENNHVLNNPNIRFIIDDGRNYISVTKQKYDVIIGDILFPMSSGSGNLFSREYFTLCKKHLQPGGLMCQWLPAHQLSLDELKIIIKTFKAVFPSASVWYGMIGGSVPVVGCIGTNGKFSIDFNSLQKKYRDPLLVNYLQESNLDNPYIFLSNFIMAGEAVDAFTLNQPLNTDDHPVVEFINPMLVDGYQERGLINLRALNEITGDVTLWVTGAGKNGPGNVEDIQNRVMNCLFEIRNIIEQL